MDSDQFVLLLLSISDGDFRIQVSVITIHLRTPTGTPSLDPMIPEIRV